MGDPSELHLQATQSRTQNRRLFLGYRSLMLTRFLYRYYSIQILSECFCLAFLTNILSNSINQVLKSNAKTPHSYANASCVGKPCQDMGFKVHNGEGPYSHPDLVSPAFLGALIPRNCAFCLPNFANKGFA